jgi:hypothetical protein
MEIKVHMCPISAESVIRGSTGPEKKEGKLKK